MLNPQGGVSVLQGDRAQGLHEWLDGLPEPICFVVDEKGFELQHEWYEATGQTFNFYGLPAELRYQMLELAFGYELYPVLQDWRFGRGTTDAIKCGASRHAIRSIVAKPYHKILSIETDMSTRMWEYAHKVIRKCFMEYYFLRLYIEHLSNAPFRLDTLQNLELQFTNYEFVLLSGMKAVPFRIHHDQNWEQATILRDIPRLIFGVYGSAPLSWITAMIPGSGRAPSEDTMAWNLGLQTRGGTTASGKGSTIVTPSRSLAKEH